MNVPPISESRYLEVSKIAQKYNWDPSSTYYYLIQTSFQYNRFADQIFYNILSNDAYNPLELPVYDPRNIYSWNDLVNYNLLYLYQRIPSIVFYTGPYNTETLFIFNYLIGINQYGLLTIDSQPGFFILDPSENFQKAYLQLPYVQLIGKRSSLERILQNITDEYMTPFLVRGQVIENYTPNLRRKFPNLQIDDVYGSMYLGIRPPSEGFDRFLSYIFSDQFFRNVLNLIA